MSRALLLLLAILVAGECVVPPDQGCRRDVTWCDTGSEGWGEG
jgi:hypothetical protein